MGLAPSHVLRPFSSVNLFQIGHSLVPGDSVLLCKNAAKSYSDRKPMQSGGRTRLRKKFRIGTVELGSH